MASQDGYCLVPSASGFAVRRVRLVFTLWTKPSLMMPWREDITATVPEWMGQRAGDAIDYTTDEEDMDVKGRITSGRLPTRKPGTYVPLAQ